MSPEKQPQSASILSWLAQASLGVAGLSLVGMVLVEGWQVLARYVLNDSPSWTESVVLLQINIAMMFSAAVGVRNGTHFGFRVLADRAQPAWRRVMRVFTQLVTLLIGAVLSGYGALMVLDTWSVKLPGTLLRQGALYVPLALGGALIVVFAAERMLAELTIDNARGDVINNNTVDEA